MRLVWKERFKLLSWFSLFEQNGTLQQYSIRESMCRDKRADLATLTYLKVLKSCLATNYYETTIMKLYNLN